MNVMFTRIYALIVCLIGVIAITVSTGIGLHAIVTAAHPTLLMSPHAYRHLRSNQAWRANAVMCREAQNTPRSGYAHSLSCLDSAWHQEATTSPSEAAVEQHRAEGMARLISDERHIATARLIRVLLVLFITIPVFILHWRIAQKYDATANRAT